MSNSANKGAGELVPIDDRMRYMQIFRFVLAAVVGGVAFLARDSLDARPLEFAAVLGAYLGFSLFSHAAWRVSRRGGLALFGFMLMLDGLFLAWTSYATGGAASPLRYLILLHLIAVALLASYRTGMKLAMWHSLLLLVVYYAQDGGILRPLTEDEAPGIGTPFEQLVGFTAIFWFVAIATASFSAVNERELRRRRYDLEALAQMATRLENVSDSQSAAETFLASIAETFDFERAILLGADDGEEMHLLATHGDVVMDGLPKAHSTEGSVVLTAMETRETQLVTELDGRADRRLAARLPGARNIMIVPLTAEGHSIGVLIADAAVDGGTRIQRRVVSMVERFASHGALALRNAWLLEQVQRMAATDGLTRIANRATFQETLERELSRAARAGEDVTLLMIDIDHFKRLNDTYGHQTGDEVLRRMAKTLRATCRAYDTPARYGGEEFALVLPRTSREDGVAIAERLRAAVAGATEEPAITISVGTATFPFDDTNADGLVGAADEALYESKNGGRDRVTASRRGSALAPS